MKVGRTSMSPLRLMITRWPGRLYRKHILHRRATASCVGTMTSSAKGCQSFLIWHGLRLPFELTDDLKRYQLKTSTSNQSVGIW